MRFAYNSVEPSHWHYELLSLVHYTHTSLSICRVDLCTGDAGALGAWGKLVASQVDGPTYMHAPNFLGEGVKLIPPCVVAQVEVATDGEASETFKLKFRGR